MARRRRLPRIHTDVLVRTMRRQPPTLRRHPSVAGTHCSFPTRRHNLRLRILTTLHRQLGGLWYRRFYRLTVGLAGQSLGSPCHRLELAYVVAGR